MMHYNLITQLPQSTPTHDNGTMESITFPGASSTSGGTGKLFWDLIQSPLTPFWLLLLNFGHPLEESLRLLETTRLFTYEEKIRFL